MLLGAMLLNPEAVGTAIEILKDDAASVFYAEPHQLVYNAIVGLYRDAYAELLRAPITAPSPDAYDREPGESAADVATRRLADMQALLERHADEVCAVSTGFS